LSYEVELFALAILFYLYDSSVLLYSNEAVLTCDSAQHWTAATGWVGFVLAGRALCVLNPFTPHRPAFRLNWKFSGLEAENTDLSWSERTLQLKALAPMTLTAGLALFILLPLGMFTALGSYAVIPALVLLYGSTILALLLLRRKRTLASFERRRFIAFAFECLACPPFAVNMVRRITLANRISEPLPLAAVRLLDAAGWAQLRGHCISRLEDAMRLVTANSNEEKLLEAQKQRLSALA
jgi:hypothetical protein